jgi:predicted nuclease of restriction endonuclease-like (RecB) superfamily
VRSATIASGGDHRPVRQVQLAEAHLVRLPIKASSGSRRPGRRVRQPGPPCVFFVDDNAEFACFDTDVSEVLVKKLAARKPLRVVFRDTGFNNDSVKKQRRTDFQTHFASYGSEDNMSKKKGKKNDLSQQNADGLFQRVAAILEQARSNVVRSVNTNMVSAYWLIGREIVEELQGGDERAEYGKQVVENLALRLKSKYGIGFSAQTLWNYRLFYQSYADRFPILSRAGRELTAETILSPTGSELLSARSPVPQANEAAHVFSPLLSWSHYRALMRVQDDEARLFYERETAECGWTKAQLERQIHSSYYQRIVANHGQAGLVATDREKLPGVPTPAVNILKTPYVLEFLGLPDSPNLHESVLEQAIIDNLQTFLLELGKGFSFVARQKQIRMDDDDFYVDLVFYNFILKCFLLIDLKIGKLTHRDVGQMDGYVRLFEDRFKVPGDNPTIGLILCSEKSEAVAKYSVLNEGRQIFASKYLQFLPTEQELMEEIERERKLIESAMEESRDQDASE